SKSSNRVKASAAAPAKPARTWPSLPRRRTLRALAFMTVLPRVTCPSPAMATLSPRRTETMVVAWNTWGFWLGSIRPPGVEFPVWGPWGGDARAEGVVRGGGPAGQPAAGHAVNPSMETCPRRPWRGQSRRGLPHRPLEQRGDVPDHATSRVALVQSDEVLRRARGWAAS